MASPSRASSGSSQLRTFGSEEDLQQTIDQRKRKRMISNSESARRSRVRKQRNLDDLTAQVGQLTKENSYILTNLNLTTHLRMIVEAENSVLLAQVAELTQRLDSLNEITDCLYSSKWVLSQGTDEVNYGDDFLNRWSLLYVNQPIMASADMFMP